MSGPRSTTGRRVKKPAWGCSALKLWFFPFMGGASLAAAQPTHTSTPSVQAMPAGESAPKSALSSEDRELARWLDVVDNWSFFEELELLEMMPALEEDDD
ncbi:MAG: hypothetical protein H6729_10420 [Deltaproteobacteria bacterium]|nr:hypothetical protein [Deltaproteobacteria bacterium]